MSTTKKLLVLLSSILCILAFTAGKTNAYEMNFGNTPAQVSPGESFVVEIAVSENTYLANGHITYDADLFTFEGVEQDNMSAAIYEKEGNISWMYTEISSTPIGETTFKFKFKAHEVTQTSSGDFTITGLAEEGAKFITTDDYTYSGTEVGGRKTQTVTIYVPEELIVSPSDMNLQVGESQNITVNKDGVTFESRDENIAIVDENGKVTGINPGVTIIKVTDQDGFTKDIIVTVTEATLVSEGDSLANKVLPQTGTQIAFTIILAIILVAILTFIFIRYKKYRKLFVMLPLLAVLAIPNMVQAFTNVDTTKIKSGIFKELDGVSNVVAISPNDSYKYGQNLVQADIDGEDGVFYGNNLGVQKVTDKNGNEVANGNAIGTAYKVSAYTLGYENEVTDYNVVLYGDADGNTTICDNDDIDVIRKDYVYNKTATDVYKIAANLYAYDDMLDVSDIQRMILKRFDNLDKLKGKDGTDGSSDTTLVNPFPEADSPIVLEPNKVTLDVSDSEAIKATGGTGELTWESREPEIATVDENGNITAVSKGNTIITVTDEDGNTATVYVIVKNPATSVIVDPNTWITELDDHETKQLTYSLTPDTDPAPDAIITWSSSDEGIATVDENGLVTPVSVGEVEITVTATVPAEDTADGVERILTDVCKVVINQAASEQDSYVDPTDVTLNLNDEYNEKTQDLTIYLSPEYSNSTVEWKIEDGRDEVKFTDTTDVTAKTVTVEGVKVTSEDLKVTVTVTNKNENLPGFTKEVTVRVIKSASTIDDVVGKDPDDIDDPEKPDNTVDGTVYPIIDGTLILPNDSTYYMGVEYDPEDATSAVEWSSDKENIVTVDSVDDVTGKITTSPDQQGYTNIKATTTDKGVESDPIKVYVAKIDLIGTDTVEEGLDIEDIVATVYPSDLRNNTIKWETADPNIATVDQNGKVHGVKEGTTTLTATLCASDESKTAVYATMTITVNPKLDITDEDGEKIEDGTEIIMPVDSIRNWTINANADILNVEVIDNNNCIDNVNTTDGNISIESANTTGVATIKVSYKNGVTEVINVTVIVGKMTIAPEEDEIFQNVSTRINVESIAPSTLAIKNETVKWSIDTENTEATDTTIKATGRESAILTSGEKTGKVTIKAEYGDTGITATCEVIVKKELIITTGDSLLVPKDQTETIKSNYSSSELKFESEDPGIATVGANTGVVTGVKEGVTTVTVTAPDGQTKQVEVTVGSLQLTGENSVEVEQWVTIVSTIQPDSLKNNRVNWTSSNPTFATVNNGVVTGIAPGTVTITATMLDNNGNETKIKAEKTITVNPKLELDVEDTIILSVGGTKDITAGSGLNDSILSFTSDDDSVATVDSNGVITGKSAGTTKVTVKYKSGATSTITVRVIVGSISLTDTNVKVGSTTEIPRTILPSALQSYGVTWTSDNTGVAQVGASTGVVTGITPGTAKITAKIAGTDISDTCTVTVYDEVNITADDILLATGEKGTVPYEYNGNTSDLQWSISPTSTATITNDGTITAGNNPATGTLTVKNKVTGQTDTANVVVGSISLTDTRVKIGSTAEVPRTILPTVLQSYGLTWTSNNPTVATVGSSTGIVTGQTVGTATITATITGTQISDTCTVTVTDDVKITADDILLATGEKGTVPYEYDGDASDLQWSINPTSTATIDNNGTITAGNSPATGIVTVKNKVTGQTDTANVIVGQITLAGASQVEVGLNTTVTPTLSPTAIQNYDVKWTSSDTGIATVNSGIVTGKTEGNVTITATVLDKNKNETNIKATKTITVNPKLELDIEDTIILKVGGTIDITSGSGLNDNILSFTSDDTSIATVSTTGVVTGRAIGTTTVTVTYKTGETSKITVRVIVGSIELTNARVKIGNTAEISRTILPTVLQSYGVTWTSDNPSVATVGASTGLVTGKAVGIATITATITGTNISDTCTVTVYDEASTGLNGATVFVGRGQTLTIPIDYAGDIKKDLEISSNTYVSCNLTDDGIEITGNSVGSTTINITGENTDETINITVINFYLNSIPNLQVGESTNVSATVSPTTIGEYGISYSKEGTYFTVDSNGLVKASSVGTNGSVIATLTKSNPLGIDSATVTSTRTVTVVASTTTIKGEKGEILTDEEIDTVKERGSIQLSAEGTSPSATFAWSSSDEKIATVDKNTGYVELISNGQVEITATDTRAGGDSAKVTINVIGVNITDSSGNEINGNVSVYTPGCNSAGEQKTKTLNKKLTNEPIAGSTVTYNWSTSDSQKATISNGVVTAQAEGTAEITITANVSGIYGGNTIDTVTVNVINDAVAQVVKTVNSQTVITQYSTVKQAVDNAVSGDTVQIIKDINQSTRFYNVSYNPPSIAISNKNITLDINGHNVKTGGDTAFTLGTNANMTITDTVGGGTLEADDYVLKMSSNANLTVTGGTLTSDLTAIENTGTGEIKIYVDESTNKSVRIASSDSDKAAIKTTGSMQIGNSTDTINYASKERYNNNTELYIKGGKYGIELVTENYDNRNKLQFNWYNGEIYGEDKAVKFGEYDKDEKFIFTDINFETSPTFASSGIKFGIITNSILNTDEYYITEKLNQEIYYTKSSLLGDIDDNGIVNISDITLLNKYVAKIVGLTGKQIKNADVNNDGNINIADVIILLQFQVQIFDKLPVDSSNDAYIYSNSTGLLTSVDTYTGELNNYSRNVSTTLKVGVPYDLNFEGFSNACTINGLKIEAGIGSGEAYLSESDYTITKVHNNKYYITFLRDWEVILNYHGATEYRNPKLIIEIDGIGEVEMKAAGTSSFDINSETSSVIGDISMDGTVDQYDYSLYKEILDGDATYNNSNLDNKITEFNNYMSSIGYSSSSNEEKLYELIKIIALQ